MIKVTDIAYARFTAPDLDKMETFLEDFGLVRSARTDTALYMRGRDPDHHFHVTELGEPGFTGMAFKAASMEDLHTLASVDGASAVEEINEPGGGYRVRITDPNGHQVETVFGMETLAPLPVKNDFKRNFGTEHQRKGELLRLEKGPCQAKRLGHIVINVESCAVNDEFYKSYFGFLSSDECYDPDDDTELVVAFNRCDRGELYVDHHTLLTVKSKESGFAHIAFEVDDINAIYLGNEHLTAKGYAHSWGIGRHILGSQIFDYWFDPWGHRVEHWTDGDLLNADSPTFVTPLKDALSSQWGVTVADRRASLHSGYDPLKAGAE